MIPIVLFQSLWMFFVWLVNTTWLKVKLILVNLLPLAHKIMVNQTGAIYLSQACSEDVFNTFQKQTNVSYRFISELMDVFRMAGHH